MAENSEFERLLRRVRACQACADLPLGPLPLVQASPESRILIIGQAPGQRTHRNGRPWQDASGVRLREWLGLSEAQFYDPKLVAIVPMAFCYPGKGKSGDLPPRKECAPLWHPQLMNKMPSISLTLLIGNYAHQAYGRDTSISLTESVRDFEQGSREPWPLPHPSPRNGIWLKKNPWFQDRIVPLLQARIRSLI